MRAPSLTSTALTVAATDQDRHATELIDAFAALPAGHPTRAALRDEAIKAWQPMARRLARRYEGRSEPLDDLVQTATMGLIKAVDRFDPARGVPFVAYAIPTVLGEIRRYFRDYAWAIRVPRRLQEMRMAINEANSFLVHSLGRSPTIAEVATHLRVTEEQVIEGLEGARAFSATSLSTPAGTEGSLELADTLGSPDHGYELTETRLALDLALQHLPERDRQILMLRFFGNQTQAQIAAQIGVSQMHISRIITRALGQMRKEIEPGTR